MAELHVRSVTKGVTWRILGTLDTMVISYFVTGGEVKMALTIGGVEVFTKIFLYYLHERIWSSVKWGRKVPAQTMAPTSELRPTSAEPNISAAERD